MRCVDLYNQTQSKWFEEMVTTCMVRRHQNPPVHVALLSRLTVLPLQELEKLEVERIEWIQTHLRQYTTLRHETDMFNQSVSPSVPSHIRVFLLPEVLLLFSGGGTCGPAAAEGGSGKRPRAVGEGEQDRRGPTRGYGHIDPSGLGRTGPACRCYLVSEHLDTTCRDHTWIRPRSNWKICKRVFLPAQENGGRPACSPEVMMSLPTRIRPINQQIRHLRMNLFSYLA